MSDELPHLKLNIQTTVQAHTTYNEQNDFDVVAATTPTAGGRARSLSQAVIPSFLTPLTPAFQRSQPTEQSQSSSSKGPKRPNRTRNESQKLLAHLLSELDGRPRPLPIFDDFKISTKGKADGGLSTLLRTVRTATSKSAPTRDEKKRTGYSSDSFVGLEGVDEDIDDHGFHTDATFDLMNQLKEVLRLSLSLGWEILNDPLSDEFDGLHFPDPFDRSSTSRKKRRSLQIHAPRSRSPSPSVGGYASRKLLSRCISILESVVQEDCRAQIRSPRLKKPPNALQAVTLDVAQLLCHINRRSPNTLYQIGLIMVPAFYTFRAEMHERLLNFFEKNVMRPMLDDLQRFPGRGESLTMHSRGKFHHNAVLHVTKQETDNTYADKTAPPVVEIQVDEPQESLTSSKPGWIQFSSGKPDPELFSVSSYTPAQAPNLYYLSSLSAPLLAAILDTVHLVTDSLPRMYSAYALLRLIMENKPDAEMDLLGVIAYHTPSARYTAIAMLATFWPTALGHVIVSKEFPVVSYSKALQRLGISGTPNTSGHFHRFIPWRLAPASLPRYGESDKIYDCQVCAKHISGFCLYCPLCQCVVHFDCYDIPEGSTLSHYPVRGEGNTEKIAMHRYSFIPPYRLDLEPTVQQRHGHTFRTVNLFTLCLCLYCHDPLWGLTSQGLRCVECGHFTHEECIKGDQVPTMPCGASLDQTHVMITRSRLTQSFGHHYRRMLFTEEDLAEHSFEEISIISSTFWAQKQLLKNGIASGALVIDSGNIEVPEFELHRSHRLYEAYLQSGRLRISPALEGFRRENHRHPSFHAILFDWSVLLFAASLVKSPATQMDIAVHNVSDTLTVGPSGIHNDDESLGDDLNHPYHRVPFTHVRDILKAELHVRNEHVSLVMLSIMQHLGFLACTSSLSDNAHNYQELNRSSCSFPIPIGLDVSPNVETLFASVEACLDDLDVSVNEVGFLLLTRKLWPSGMASDYALERLGQMVLTWVLTEEARLSTVVHDFASQDRPLPGVPDISDHKPWPDILSRRSVAPTAAGNTRDYVTCRRALLIRYALPWLLALHDLSSKLYSNLLFHASSNMARVSSSPDDHLDKSGRTQKEAQATWANEAFRNVLKLFQSSVTFTVVDELLLRYLDTLDTLELYSQPIPVLPRLFNRESEVANRSSIVADSWTAQEHILETYLDPWRVLVNTAAGNLSGLKKGLKWLCLFVKSGVNVPTTVFFQFAGLGRDLSSGFDDHCILVETIFFSIWMKSSGRLELQSVLSEILNRNIELVLDKLSNANENRRGYRLLRQILVSCLLLYGCERSSLCSMGLINEAEIEASPSRRKTSTRSSAMNDILSVDADLMSALVRCLAVRDEEMYILLGKFLISLISTPNQFESFEIDNFVLKNSQLLTNCAWTLYDVTTAELAATRTSLLLKVAVIDIQPLETLLEDQYNSQLWEIRLQTTANLFKIILDISYASFAVEGHQWRASVARILQKFFARLWTDQHEAVRLATSVWCDGFMKPHFEAMTKCWDEALTTSPIFDRLQLAFFLLQLKARFTRWQVVSWNVVLDIILDEELPAKFEDNPTVLIREERVVTDNSRSTILQDPDLVKLHTLLAVLSLRILSDGSPIDIQSLTRLKLRLAQLLGASGVLMRPSASRSLYYIQLGQFDEIPDHATPCIEGLQLLLDATSRTEISVGSMTGSGDENFSMVLIGSPFIDIALHIFNSIPHLLDLPFLTLKILVHILTIIIYKHDLEANPLRHLREPLRKAVRKVTDIVNSDGSLELRQLSLSVCHAYIKNCSQYVVANNFLVDQVQTVIDTLPGLQYNVESHFVVQAVGFVGSAMLQFATSGLFYQLCKRQQNEEFFTAMKLIIAHNERKNSAMYQNLRNVIIQDTFERTTRVPLSAQLRTVMTSNVKSFVELIHYRDYPVELMHFVGQHLVHIIGSEAFDPNPWLDIATTLLQHNKARSRDFLAYTETALRAALTRSEISFETLERLIQVSSRLHRQTTKKDAQTTIATPINSLLLVILDTLSDTFRGKSRMNATTLINSCKAVLPHKRPESVADSTVLQHWNKIIPDGLYFLHTYILQDSYTATELSASLAVAILILNYAEEPKRILTAAIDEISLDRTPHVILSIRLCNVLVLAALQSSECSFSSAILLQLPIFSAVFKNLLFGNTLSTELPKELTAAVVNHAYSAIKLWLLLARKCKSHALSSNEMPMIEEAEYEELRVWNELWPSFERLLASDTTLRSDTRSPVTLLLWSSAAELFLFLRQIRSVLALESFTHIAMLNRAKSLGRIETSTSQFSRAVNSILETPPEVPSETLVNQAMQDMLAADKLLCLEAKDWGRAQPVDRNRRELRATS